MAEPSQDSSPSQEAKAQERASPETSVLHKIVTAIGATLVIASLGILLYDELAHKESPPDIVLHVNKIERQPSGNFVVLFRAENRGNSTAADLFVSGELQDAAGNRETSTARLDYVPAQSEREGGLFFKNDPQRAQLELRATGFQKP